MTALVQINITLPAIGHLGSALIAVVFLYTPVLVAWRRKEQLDDYGFHAEPVRRGVMTALAGIAVIFPLFVFGYLAFWELANHWDWLRQLLPHNVRDRYGGLNGIHAPALTWKLAEFCLVQLVVVALPEELFFRGFLLELLERRFPPKRRWLGGGVGLALVLSAAAFAIIHLPREGDPRALATFFPGLLFGWMRSATRSILASTITHGASNILIRFLELSILR